MLLELRDQLQYLVLCRGRYPNLNIVQGKATLATHSARGLARVSFSEYDNRHHTSPELHDIVD